MTEQLTHASFFSGVGGLDLGLERAGWQTVSFSEIDPYASAVLRQHWPDVPNLGDIVELAQRDGSTSLLLDSGSSGPSTGTDSPIPQSRVGEGDSLATRDTMDGAWKDALLWSGGFPCQDLSIAGKKAGFAGERSSLARSFLSLAADHQPPFILLENVPGLFSSNKGRDFLELLSTMDQLGYGVAWRVLDARYFGVPQRRRRVFIVGSLGSDRAGQVLFEPTGSRRDSEEGEEQEPQARAGSVFGVDLAHAVTGTSAKHHDPDTDTLIPVRIGAIDGSFGHHGVAYTVQSAQAGHFIVSAPPDPAGSGEGDGVARRVDDRRVLPPLRAGVHGEPGIGRDGDEDRLIVDSSSPSDHDLLPKGIDSHRYRCAGNGVVAPVAEWIGRRLAAVASTS